MSPSQIAKNLIERIDDKIFALDIRAAIERSNAVRDARFVNIATQRGVVTLSGNVPSWELYFAAQRIVTGVKGVQSVINKLVVTPDVMLTMGDKHASLHEKSIRLDSPSGI